MDKLKSRPIEGEKVETVTYFVFLGSKTTADDDYSHEIKRRLLLGRKTMTNLEISWLHSPFAVILESKKIKSVTVSIVFALFAMK